MAAADLEQFNLFVQANLIRTDFLVCVEKKSRLPPILFIKVGGKREKKKLKVYICLSIMLRYCNFYF